MTSIKKVSLICAFATMAGIIISNTAFTNNNGKEGKTGSPGETACNQCHSTNPLNSGGGSVVVSSAGLTNWTYVPGQTYNIDVTVKRPGSPKFGFGFEALLPSGANAGVISTTNSPNAKSLSATILGNVRTNAVHKQPNHFGTDSLVFTFEWTAPAAGTGDITFYAAGNATNNANNSSGDFIYTTNQVVTEANTTQLQQILEGKYVNVFPNPCADYLNISVPNNLSLTSTLIQLFDLSGKKVFEKSMNGRSTVVDIRADVNGLEAGLYIVQLQNGSWVHNERLIVKK
jgi:hypothetical protein